MQPAGFPAKTWTRVMVEVWLQELLKERNEAAEARQLATDRHELQLALELTRKDHKHVLAELTGKVEELEKELRDLREQVRSVQLRCCNLMVA
jgi:chromosome segregation ATPase